MNLNLKEYDASEVQLTTVMNILKLIYDGQLEDGSLIIENNIIFRYDNKRNEFYDKNGEPLIFYPSDLKINVLLIVPTEKL